MKKRDKQRKAPAEPPSEGMSIDEIAATISTFRGMSETAAKGLGYKPGAVNREALACEAITNILNALQAEGIKDPEQVRDLIHDYNALAAQYQSLHQKYEVGDKPVRLGIAFICPACNRQIKQLYTAHCWNCGKRLDWGR